MFTTYTYQDYLAAEDKIALLCKAIEKFKASAEFTRALNASSYFRGENPTIARKTILRARKIETRGTDGRRHVRAGTEDVVGNRIGSSFLFRFVTQQNQFLLSECVSLPEETKKRLGADFDHLLSRLGECALLHGVSYGYWNADHLEIIEMARSAESGFFPLLDEMTGELMLGVQFWQLGAKRPMFLRLFEQDGVTIFRISGKQVDVVRPKTGSPPRRAWRHPRRAAERLRPSAAHPPLRESRGEKRADTRDSGENRRLRQHSLRLCGQPRPRERCLLGAEQLQRHDGRHCRNAGGNQPHQGGGEPVRRFGQRRNRRAAHD